MGIRDWLFGGQQASTAARETPPPVVPPRPVTAVRKPAARFTTVDVPGTWERTATGYEDFQKGMEAIPLGPVKVALRLKPNRANPYGIAAYVGSQQVGWLATEWSATDEWVECMTRLDAARIRPRFDGVHKISEVFGEHVVYFMFPGRDDPAPAAIADRLIGGAR